MHMPTNARTLGLALATVLAAPLTLAVTAQETHPLHAERTFDYRTDKVFDLQSRIGQVRIASVEFRDLGRGHGGSIADRMRGGESETSTTIRAHFLAENTTSEDWQVTFTLEFLDKSGKIIDRVSRKAKWDNESHPLDVDHQILEYVVPMIAQVRIKLEGKQD